MAAAVVLASVVVVEVIAAALDVVVIGLLVAAIWPPKWASERWRTWTRPLRRKARPRHYPRFMR